METMPSAMERQGLIASFLEIAAGQTADTAVQFLQATSWELEEAIQLFYIGGDGGGGFPTPSSTPPTNPSDSSGMENAVVNDIVAEGADEDGVRAPLPVKRETLYGEASVMARYG